MGEIQTEQVTLLTATNRKRDGAGNGFEGTWAGTLTYEQYKVSIPPDRSGTTIQYPKSPPKFQSQFAVTERKQISKNVFVKAATGSVRFDGTVGIFVHGYNYSYQEALFRTAQMAADADAPSALILFSWPSAATITGYVADRDAALYSRGELDSLVKSLSASSAVKRIVLLGHSMGGLLVMEAVRELKLQHRDDVIEKLVVVLAAPDIDVDVFRSQLMDVGRMPTPITLLVSKDDRVLSVSSVIGGERARVGRLSIDDPLIGEAALQGGLRAIDITSVQGSDGLGHDRYASLAKFGAQFASYGRSGPSSAGDVGAFIFDAASAVATSPFRIVRSQVVAPR
ncbi:alpha/beta hydrolase [Rhizobium leguminosarum]|uniref:alpha/beta hydrolase n=1 Tax=Rhizobium leguminosarum TaxID=384 RepID=UPI003F9B7B55